MGPAEEYLLSFVASHSSGLLHLFIF